MSMKNIYTDLDCLKKEIIVFLNGFNKSKILQDYFFSYFCSFIYGNLVLNFFNNLNLKIIVDNNLPKGKINIIKSKYSNIIKESNDATKAKSNSIDKDYYNSFKSNIKRDYPDFFIIIDNIEKSINIDKLEKSIIKAKSEFRNTGNIKLSLDNILITSIFESYIQHKKILPSKVFINNTINYSIKKILPKHSDNIFERSLCNINNMLDNNRKYQDLFEKRLYRRWKKAIDLLESLINISLESCAEHKNKLSIIPDNKNMNTALMNIHARAIQISNEILVLIKAGYADGAIARWRSLHELAVISFFLKNNNDDVSRRYLDHEIIKKYKNAKDYNTYHKKLKYPPISKREFNLIKKEKDRLCSIYKDRYQDEYGWIPKHIISYRNFRELEKHVNIDKLHPFYNLSCDSIHGGSKGFYRLGLMNGLDNNVLLVGPSNYGLADPIQNTAISLLHISTCFLTIEPDYGNLIKINVMNNYFKEISQSAVDIQKQIEKEAKSNNTNK